MHARTSRGTLDKPDRGGHRSTVVKVARIGEGDRRSRRILRADFEAGIAGR
jgi:hypothetical protein